METWIWIAIIIVLLLMLGAAKKGSNKQESALENYIIFLLFSDEVRSDHQQKLREFVKNFPTSDAVPLGVQTQIAIKLMANHLDSGERGSLVGAFALLQQVKAN